MCAEKAFHFAPGLLRRLVLLGEYAGADRGERTRLSADATFVRQLLLNKPVYFHAKRIGVI